MSVQPTAALWMKIGMSCLGVAALVPARCIGHQPIELRPVIRVKQHALGFKVLPLSESNGLAIWSSTDAGGTLALHAMEVTSTRDRSFSCKILVENMSHDDGWDASEGPEGDVLVIWETKGRISAQCFAKDMSPRWKEPIAMNPASSAGFHPRIVWDRATGWFAVWQEKLSSTEQPLIVRHFGLNGSALWAGVGLRVSNRASRQESVELVSGGLGKAIIAWKDVHENASEIRSQQVESDGHLRWGDEGLAVTAPAGLKEKPDVAPAGSGAAVFAWTVFPSGVHHTMVQRVGPDGQFTWPSTGLDIAPGNWGAWNPRVIGHQDDGFWVGWEDFRDESHWQLCLRHWSERGKSLWQADGVLLAPTNADQNNLALAAAGHGAVWAAWRDDRSTSPGIYAQKIDAQGHRLKGFFGLTIANHLSKPSSPVIVALPGGGAAVAFTDTDPAGCCLYVQVLGD